MAQQGQATAIASIIGAGIGTVVAPGLGTAIGAGIGQMAGSMIDLGIAQKKQDALPPLPGVDPLVLKFMNELERDRRSIRAGAVNSYSKAVNVAPTIANAAVALGGGNTGSIISTLTGAQRAADESIEKVTSDTMKMNQFNTGLLAQINDSINTQRFQTAMVDVSKEAANVAFAQTSVNNAATSFIASLAEVKPGVGGGDWWLKKG